MVMTSSRLVCILTALTLVLSGNGRVFGQFSFLFQPKAEVAVIQVKNMCCAKESAPAIEELSKIPGVSKVVPDYKAKTLTIVPKGTALPSPIAVWQAAEDSKVEPIRLTSGKKVYTTKPTK